MRSTYALALVVAALACSVAGAQDQDFSKVQLKPTKVAGGVYMLEGAGGNIGVSVGDDGIAIVDDQFAPLVDKIRAALKGIADKPVRFVINTHCHEDHTGGNAPMSTTSAIIAQENVRRRLQAGGGAGNRGSLHFDSKPAVKAALPILTFEHDVTLHMNGEDIRVEHFGRAHTDGDSVVFFPTSNVVHMGDIFVTYGFPFIDLEGGGSVDGMIAAIQEILPKLPADVKIIPGHGGVSTPPDMKRFLGMLEATRAVVAEGIDQGKTLEQLQQEKVLERWNEWSGQFVSTDKFIETLYNDLKSVKAGELPK
ncbi:MAG TPA: MBL fold metallo-hydrolase [Candidatus Polarisedimenticolaceae bacterium]|nr:MBL fold metallo-hydrolase [Candidatus Polarisedimenticolaceae bacterium]